MSSGGGERGTEVSTTASRPDVWFGFVEFMTRRLMTDCKHSAEHDLLQNQLHSALPVLEWGE